MSSVLLPWQQQQWHYVNQRIAQKHLAHAMLLTGKTGLGKRLFARYLAQALLCSNTGTDHMPCGNCRNCQLYEVGNHPDYLFIEPEDHKKPIRIDQIRTVVEFLEHTSQSRRYKIVLIDPAERMNLNAANSLLKTLEEPPGASMLLLLTSAPSQLPITIRSRCQQLA